MLACFCLLSGTFSRAWAEEKKIEFVLNPGFEKVTDPDKGPDNWGFISR